MLLLFQALLKKGICNESLLIYLENNDHGARVFSVRPGV